MRQLTTILFLFILHKLNAATYYVSNAGNDLNDGLTTGTSWETLGKVNSTATSGDTVKLKCNDIWLVTNRLIPASSNIYYTSYSTGAKPLVTGFVTATVGSPTANVYTINVSDAVADLNTVLINGKLAIKARYPNSTYLTFTSGTDSTLITSLTGTPSYAGKEIVIRVTHWIIDVTNVTNQSTGTLSLSPKLTYPVNTSTFGGNGYFFQNDVTFLDSLNEYVYDSVNKVLKVYATSTPTVQYSTADTLVWMRQKTNITVDGIAFTGANKTAFQLDTCSRITITNSTLNNNGTNGITGYKSHHITISNDSIQNCLNGAIYLRRFDPYTPMQDTCNNATITGNYISNAAIYAGMSLNDNERGIAVAVMGDSLNISNNTIDSSGYIPIKWNGRWSLIKNNYITNYCFVKDDGGGIYSVIGAYVHAYFDTASIIRGNIITNGIGAIAGVNLSASFAGTAAGIYLDDNLNGPVLVDSNTVNNTYAHSLNLRTVRKLTTRGNLFVDSVGVIYQFTGNQAQTYELNFKGNIYYQRNSANYVSNTGSLGAFTYESDSNYILKPVDTTTTLRYNSVNYSLSGYKAATSYEQNSNGMPTLSDGNRGILYYNPSNSDSTFSVGSSYVDVYGNKYFGSFTLTPFTSVLLFPVSSISFSKTYFAQ